MVFQVFNKQRLVLLLTIIISSASSCTKPQLSEVSTRIGDSLSGNLVTPSNLDPAGTNNFSFAVMGDIHMGSPFGHNLDQAIQEALNGGDSFALLAGDLTDNGQSKDFDTVINAFTDQGLSYRPALGNHDIFFDGWSNYKKKMGPATYSFDADHVHFSVIDSANGVIGERQFNWLKSDLAGTSQPIKIIVTHFAPFTGVWQSPWRLSSDEESAILKNIAYENSVAMVIAGHYHGYQEKNIGGTIYLTTGATNKIPNVGNEHHFVRVTINGTSITTHLVEL